VRRKDCVCGSVNVKLGQQCVAIKHVLLQEANSRVRQRAGASRAGQGKGGKGCRRGANEKIAQAGSAGGRRTHIQAARTRTVTVRSPGPLRM
jgi:hypothetical protein